MFNDLFFNGFDLHQLSGHPREKMSWLIEDLLKMQKLDYSISYKMGSNILSVQLTISLLYLTVCNCRYDLQNFISTVSVVPRVQVPFLCFHCAYQFQPVELNQAQHKKSDVCPTEYFCCCSPEMPWVKLHEVVELSVFLLSNPAKSYSVTLLTRLWCSTHALADLIQFVDQAENRPSSNTSSPPRQQFEQS